MRKKVIKNGASIPLRDIYQNMWWISRLQAKGILINRLMAEPDEVTLLPEQLVQFRNYFETEDEDGLSLLMFESERFGFEKNLDMDRLESSNNSNLPFLGFWSPAKDNYFGKGRVGVHLGPVNDSAYSDKQKMMRLKEGIPIVQAFGIKTDKELSKKEHARLRKKFTNEIEKALAGCARVKGISRKELLMNHTQEANDVIAKTARAVFLEQGMSIESIDLCPGATDTVH